MAKEEKDKEESLTMVGPGAEDGGEETVVDESEERESPDREADDEEGHREDTRAGHDGGGDDDEDRTAIRARRREEKLRKKENRRRDQVELNFLRQRNDQLERRFSELETRQGQSEVLSIDSRISGIEQQIREAEAIHAQAIEGKKGEEATEALRIRDELRDGLNILKNAKAAQQRNEQARREGGRVPRVDPAIARRATQWIEEHDWFDPNLGDEESMIAKAIEDRLYREGRFDAKTDAYWEEYDRRLKKRMPHLFESSNGNGQGRRRDEEDDDDDDEESEQREQRRAAPRGPRITTGGRERPLKKGEVYVSRDRMEAMKEAGVWDDPKLRERYLKKYQEYDRNHGVRRQ